MRTFEQQGTLVGCNRTSAACSRNWSARRSANHWPAVPAWAAV